MLIISHSFCPPTQNKKVFVESHLKNVHLTYAIYTSTTILEVVRPEETIHKYIYEVDLGGWVYTYIIYVQLSLV